MNMQGYNNCVCCLVSSFTSAIMINVTFTVLTANFRVLMNDKEFRSNSYQRVYQFIRRYRAGKNIDEFCFENGVEGSAEDCLEMLLE